MAEAVLDIVIGNLSSLIQKEVGLFLGVNEEMRRLSSILTTIKAVLEDAEEKQLTNRSLQDWLRKLRDAAHSLDDILDECSTEDLAMEYQPHKCGLVQKVHASCLSAFYPKHVLFRIKIAKKLKEIRERLDEIAEERTKFHLSEIVTDRRNEVMEWRQTISRAQPQVYGREEEKEKIVDFLVGDASNFEDLSVYPVVGIGGLGKTTLAQLVFNDERVLNHFDLKIWVCVSEDFSLKRMSKAILESASKLACEDLDLEPLQSRLQELLRRKRYFLVLDDVWNDNLEKWDKLKSVLACGSKGASILITTRLTKVASIMGTMPPHQLSLLSEDDCWELFKHRAFGQDKGECAELVDIGKEIVKKCKGVPLAAKALGSLLHFKREVREWLHVKESEIWSLPQDEHSILPALRLSYLNLTPKLRQCFAYCALFPKDYPMSKEEVIELWMANGFISSNGRLEVEDDGDRVWNELYLRSFFQDVEINDDDHDTLFNMHDLVHDLAQSVTKDEYCCITNENVESNLSGRFRHISIHTYKQLDGPSLQHLLHDNSFKVYINPIFSTKPPPLDILMKCYSLRLLEIRCLKELSSSIVHLKHLRYLNLSSGTFKTLPDSICRLYNLQILNLNSCGDLQKLPNRLKCLKSLRHLHLKRCTSLSSMAPEMGQLTSLQTLDTYVVGKQKGFMLAEIKQLKLKGTLHIKHLERVKSAMDAKEANLADKHLNELVLSWGENEESKLQKNVEQILEFLQPHTQQLQTLTVGGYLGTQLPRWMRDPTLKDLRLLELADCENCVQIPPLGKLPSLQKLKLSNLNHVQFIDEESYDVGVARGFKALNFLILERLPNLEKLSKEEGDNIFPCLSTLQVSHCPKLFFPCLPSVTQLFILNECEQAILRSIQNLGNLECLWLIKNKELTSFPDGMLGGLTFLKEFHIVDHNKLEVLPTECSSLNALEELHIVRCNNLETLTEQVLEGLHSLKRLKLCGYANFKLSASFQCLTSLEHLTIAGCPEVEAFPDTLRHMAALQSLTLYDLPNLASLPDWLGNLRLLKSLSISKCPKLMSLPTSIRDLSSLKNLEIYSCSELEKRCEEETGEDWHKIAHVPRIRIESTVYQLDEFGYSCYLSLNMFVTML